MLIVATSNGGYFFIFMKKLKVFINRPKIDDCFCNPCLFNKLKEYNDLGLELKDLVVEIRKARPDKVFSYRNVRKRIKYHIKKHKLNYSIDHKPWYGSQGVPHNG